MISSGLASFQQSYELCPIFLVQGIAQSVGGKAPITNYTQNGYTPVNANDYFARFKPLSGSTLESWGVAEYPLAALTVAANATVQQPLNISLLMQCPAQTAPGNNYGTKLNIITALKSTLDNHILQGGWFEVHTPAFVYEGCLLTSLKDVTGSDTKQVQSLYQWDFYVPLITQTQAQSIQTSAMARWTNQLPVNGQPTYNSNTAWTVG